MITCVFNSWPGIHVWYNLNHMEHGIWTVNSDINIYETYAKASIKVTLLRNCKPISTGCETAEPQIKFCAWNVVKIKPQNIPLLLHECYLSLKLNVKT